MKKQRLSWIFLGLFLVVYPLVVPPFWALQIGAQPLFIGIIALSLIFLTGYGGMVSLAQMTIAGMAGYALSYFGVNSVEVGIPLPWPISLLSALVLGTLGGVLIGAVAVRTKGIYCLMITLAFSIGFYYLTLQNYTVFNGFTGFSGISPPSFFGTSLRDPVPFYYLCLLCATILLSLVLYVSRSPFGLALQGLRDADRRLRALGFRTGSHRIAAFGFAGFIASVGGVLSVWYNGRISPGSVGVGPIIDILVIAMIGGVTHPIGAFIGAILFTLMENFAIDLIDRERFNTFIGLIFLAIVMFSPDGLVGLWGRVKMLFQKQSISPNLSN